MCQMTSVTVYFKQQNPEKIFLKHLKLFWNYSSLFIFYLPNKKKNEIKKSK